MNFDFSKKNIQEKFILENGKRYIPEKLPEDIQYGKVSFCFDVSFIQAFKSKGKYRYVEGLAKNIKTGEWVLHAWLTDEKGIACYDPTWKMVVTNKSGNKLELPLPVEYIGIEMDTNLVAQFLLKVGYQGVLANASKDLKLSSEIIDKYMYGR